MKKVLLLLAAFALILAACGGGDDDETAALPINDNTDATPALDATCLAGEPDCNDTPGGEPQDLPSGDDGAAPIVSMSIADAVDASGQVTITGYLVDVAGEAQLCEVLAESFPPQCGGASVTLTSLDQIDPDELKTEGDVTWTDNAVTVFGEMVDGTLVATAIE